MDAERTAAQAALERDDLAAAAPLLARVLERSPGDAAARAWLGQCLCGLDRQFEGLRALREAAAQFAAQGAAASLPLGELVEELLHWGDVEAASRFAEAAAEAAPGDAAAWRRLALGLAQTNRPAEALAAQERALALAPPDAAARVFQASLEADAGQPEAARARLAAVLAGQPEPRAAFRAHKELARVLDQLRRYDEVFPQLHAAGALAARLPEYRAHDLRAMPALIAENRTSFDAALLRRWQGRVPPGPRAAPVFLLGFLRSGTTLTQQVLAAHPAVFVSDEVNLIPRLLRALHQRDPARLPTADKLRRLDAAGLAALRALYWQLVEDRFGPITQPVFVDKLTMNTIDLGLIGTLFPEAPIVFVQRDPRDVCLSAFQQLMVPSPVTVQVQEWRRAAGFYAEVMGWWRQVRPLLGNPVFELRYERAVAGFEAEIRALLGFLGLGWVEAVRDFHRGAAGRYIASPSRRQVAQPLYAGSVARWRRFAGEFAPVEATLAPLVEAFGYPPA